MNRKEPYIGMPIILGEYEDAAAVDKVASVEAVNAVEIQPIATPISEAKPEIHMPIAMAYVPWQQWQEPYEFEKGFSVGTIFPDLNLPFMGYQGGMKR